MRTYIATLLFASSFAFEGCTYVPGVEPTDLSSIRQETATRAETEKALGDPLEISDTEVGVINIYSYDGGADGNLAGVPLPGGGDPILTIALGALLTPFVWSATPIMYSNKVEEQTRFIGITYSSDDQVSYYEFGRHANDLKESMLENLTREIRAENGDPDAQYEIGIALNDYRQSWEWFCLAAHRNHAKAQYAVGNFYRWGDGPIPESKIRAYVWYSLSANQGYYLAIDAHERTTAQMDAAQIAEAENLVGEWTPNPAECGALAEQAGD